MAETRMNRDATKHDERLGPEEYAGYTLCDPVRREIGEVEQLFSGGGGRPQYVMVKIRAGFFGRKRSVLIPVTDIAVSEEQRIITLG